LGGEREGRGSAIRRFGYDTGAYTLTKKDASGQSGYDEGKYVVV